MPHVPYHALQIHPGLARHDLQEELVELRGAQACCVLSAKGLLHTSGSAVVARNDEKEPFSRLCGVCPEIPVQQNAKVGGPKLDVLVGPDKFLPRQKPVFAVNELARLQRSGTRDELHEAHGTRARHGPGIEYGLGLNDGQNEFRCNFVDPCRLLHIGQILANPCLEMVRDELDLDLLAQPPNAVRGRIALRRPPGTRYIMRKLLDVRPGHDTPAAGHPDLALQVPQTGRTLAAQQEGEPLRQEPFDTQRRILEEDGSDGADLENAPLVVDTAESIVVLRIRNIDGRTGLPHTAPQILYLFGAFLPEEPLGPRALPSLPSKPFHVGRFPARRTAPGRRIRFPGSPVSLPVEPQPVEPLRPRPPRILPMTAAASLPGRLLLRPGLNAHGEGAEKAQERDATHPDHGARHSLNLTARASSRDTGQPVDFRSINDRILSLDSAVGSRSSIPIRKP